MPATETVVPRPIRPLAPGLVNKIAAGEVVERPSSVLKELLENSVDAGARRIDVAVHQGGLHGIRVADDGMGIPAGELTLAVASHATSKLNDAEDLFRIQTLGFRGEALASIAEVSRMVLRSRPAGAAAGAEIRITGGVCEGPSPIGCPPGTVVDVQDLFFNTPVRRKFLRTPQTEMAHVTEAFTRIALGFPQIHLTLAHQDRPVFDLRPCGDWRERIATFFGAELADSLIWVECRDEAMTISGFVAHPSYSRSHNRLQYLFLNGRHIRDRSLQHALGEAFRGLLMVGRYPVAFLRLEMPAEFVDVNVHPTKLEVRFEDGRRVYSQLLGAIRNRFLASDLSTKWRSSPVHAQAELPDFEDPNNSSRTSPRAREEVSTAQELAENPHSPSGSTLLPIADGEQGMPTWPPGESHLLQLHRLAHRPSLPPSAPALGGSRGASVQAPPSRASTGTAPAAIQVMNRYLVTENETGIVVIDQHALHERILYEQLKARFGEADLERQGLIVPEPVDLSPGEFALAMEHRELLLRLGLAIEPFGGETVLLQSHPCLLANVPPGELLREFLEGIATLGPGVAAHDLCDHLLHAMACKAAVKAGDPLAPEEIQALISLRDQVVDAHHCPHGRPTALVFTREQLDRQFKRS